MSREDEDEFISFLQSTDSTIILPSRSSTSGFAPLDMLPEASQDEATRKFWLQNTSITLPLVTEFDEETGYYLINGFQSPVVEFLRSFTSSKRRADYSTNRESLCEDDWLRRRDFEKALMRRIMEDFDVSSSGIVC